MAKTLRSTAFVALFSLVALATSFSATTDTLADLANGGTLAIGDKVFSNFSFQNNGLTTFDPSNIQVTASIVNGVYFLTWDGNMSLSSTGPITADLILKYSVTANNGRIDGIDASFTGSAQPHTIAFVSLDENAYDSQNHLVGSLHLDDQNPPGSHSAVFAISPPQKTLNITKDIGFAISGRTGGFVTVSEIGQSFHQVPEPGTAMLLGIGLLSTSFYFRRHRS